MSEIKEAPEQTTNIVVTITKKTTGTPTESVEIKIDITDVFKGDVLSQLAQKVNEMLRNQKAE
jgi:hypothetical protein